jgi:hypothetical protein
MIWNIISFMGGAACNEVSKDHDFGQNRRSRLCGELNAEVEMRRLLLVLLCLGISACAWVKLTQGGEKVRVLDADEVSTCKELGNTTVSLMAKVAGVNRDEKEVSKELSYLARNAAADMRGDTIVPISAIKDGKRTYKVYKCIGVTAE